MIEIKTEVFGTLAEKIAERIYINPVGARIDVPKGKAGREKVLINDQELYSNGITETIMIPSQGDQRIWNVWHDIDGEGSGLTITQHRVLAFKIIRYMGSDLIDVIPISAGLQFENNEKCDGYCSLLIDRDLKIVYEIDINKELQNRDWGMVMRQYC